MKYQWLIMRPLLTIYEVFSLFFLFLSFLSRSRIFYNRIYARCAIVLLSLSLSLSVDLLLNSVCKCGKVASAKKRRRETNRCNFERRDLLDE